MPCNVLSKGAFRLGVRDSSVESPNTMLVVEDLNLLTMKILYYINIHLTLSYHPFNIHWVPPRMPPRFSFNTGLTSSVNALEVH
jgi:hypothetical protein